jgi:hypothetical protein
VTNSKIGLFKKKNPEREPDTLAEAINGPVMLEPLPPLRTFVVRLFIPGADAIETKTIYAHGYDFGDNGSIAFIVVFYNTVVAPQPVKMQAPQFIFAEGTWLSVEERHLDFPRVEADVELSVEGS